MYIFKKAPCFYKKSGFTLLELLVSTGILLMLFFFAPPFVQSILSRNHLQAAVSELKSIVIFSRNQALIYSRKVVLAPKSGMNQWKNGLVLFVDDGIRQTRLSPTMIHEWGQSAMKGCDIRWHGLQSNSFLLFSPGIKNSMINGHFLVSNKSGCYRLIINRLGRMKTQTCN
ncbi:pilus assembly FimT family protein [Legionella londiniensis]|uniref:pilus assembly FimT family protein n=1 Tax=Legionella londiniensis TaxID=45068 RepID=UPI0007308B96|nr:prepilin-type N-terminal cleavage/methylation domain-containing protein [Legionella londiniensis]